MSGFRAMGTRATGERLTRMQASSLFREGKFVDVLPRKEPDIVGSLSAYVGRASSHKQPKDPVPFVTRSGADFAQAPQGDLRVTWLGHSTQLIEIAGRRFLIDPVWGERAAPFSWVGPRRFHPPPLPLEELPELDAVLISHDHYDHLDHPTILRLKESDVLFVVPLGVGAHLEYWGVAKERIVELEWWQEYWVGDVRLVCTPSRHFSGRSLVMADRDATLWSGWALLGTEHKVYFSGDTAMFPGFAEIGQRLGPFDIAMIEAGAYDRLWADVHLGPEQAVLAARLVRAKLLLPVHWGTFDLALHGWTEPMERVLVAAEAVGQAVATPRIGQSIDFAAPPLFERWWPQLPHDLAAVHPVVSSGLDQDALHALAFAEDGSRAAQ